MVRDQIGLAYLFARAADTIADTDVIERTQRLTLLKDFQAQFGVEGVQWETVPQNSIRPLPHQASAGERTMLQRLEECFQRLHAFTQEDEQRIRALMKTLTKGMEMDLTVFMGDSAKELRALQTMEELDRYTYYVAGCVGEFWTHMVAAHLPSLTHWNVPEMVQVGMRFGKGLQLTNIVERLGRDLQRGRCYIPDVLLQRSRVEPTDLLNKAQCIARTATPSSTHRVARDHRSGLDVYISHPTSRIALRLACMWPILFAGETLWRVAESTECLDPGSTLKCRKVKCT